MTNEVKQKLCVGVLDGRIQDCTQEHILYGWLQFFSAARLFRPIMEACFSPSQFVQPFKVVHLTNLCQLFSACYLNVVCSLTFVLDLVVIFLNVVAFIVVNDFVDDIVMIDIDAAGTVVGVTTAVYVVVFSWFILLSILS